MIDLNFIRYAHKSKQSQMEYASIAELPKLTAECSGLLRLLGEGDIRPEDTKFNQDWLTTKLISDERPAA